jgi:hypothetical protein
VAYLEVSVGDLVPMQEGESLEGLSRYRLDMR